MSMFALFDQVRAALPLYMLIFIRLSAFLTAMPFFGSKSVYPRSRIHLAFFMTLVIGPIVSAGNTFATDNAIELAFAIVQEIFIGLIIGFSVRMIFEAAGLAGAFLSLQMGFAIMNVVDPNSDQSFPIVGQFWAFLFTIFFLANDGHHLLVATLFHNFAIIPPYGASISPDLGDLFVAGGTTMFDLAIRFAAPGFVFLLLMEIALAFVARVMPQMNIFFVSIPLKIMLGLIIILLSVNMIQIMFGTVLDLIKTTIEATMMEM